MFHEIRIDCLKRAHGMNHIVSADNSLSANHPVQKCCTMYH